MMAMNAQASGPAPTNRGRQHRVRLPDPYRFQAGGELRAASLAVETWGTLNAAHDNAILLFTGLSASAHAASTAEDPTAGWWEDLIGPGKALDTDRYFIVCANTLGSCFGSSGPGDIDPATARPYGYTWPELRVEDIARSAQVAVEHFGIDTLYAAIGASLGGMSVLAHAALFPGKARRLASLSGTMAASAFAIATRALQREMVGTALAGGAIDLGLAFRFARKVGMLSYIGAALLENRFAHTSGSQPAGASGTHFEVESWLDHQAQKFAARSSISIAASGSPLSRRYVPRVYIATPFLPSTANVCLQSVPASRQIPIWRMEAAPRARAMPAESDTISPTGMAR
jgi:homoserine O-acetyltransferase